jgi:hypothetical protein
MKRLFQLSVILALLAVPSLVTGQNKHRVYPLGTKLSAVSLNAAPASRTFTVGPTIGNDRLLDYGTLVMEIAFTHTNNGAITTTCTTGLTAATATKTMTTCTVSAGDCNLQWGGVMVTPTLTTDTSWSQRLNIRGHPALSCVVSHGGTPAAGDVVTLTAYLVTD